MRERKKKARWLRGNTGVHRAGMARLEKRCLLRGAVWAAWDKCPVVLPGHGFSLFSSPIPVVTCLVSAGRPHLAQADTAGSHLGSVHAALSWETDGGWLAGWLAGRFHKEARRERTTLAPKMRPALPFQAHSCTEGHDGVQRFCSKTGTHNPMD